MPLTPSLIHALKRDYPEVSFIAGDEFMWSPDNRSVTYNPKDADADALLLHEVSHAGLSHASYSRDIELVAMESAAWQRAREIAPSYDTVIDEALAQDNLDSYRDWLHARSTCPHCQATGVQVASHTYRCVACSGTWRVNEAKTCQLRRYTK